MTTAAEYIAQLASHSDRRDTVPEADRDEYDRLTRRTTPSAALAILRGRARDRIVAEAEPVADEVVRSLLGLPPRVDLSEADAIVAATR